MNRFQPGLDRQTVRRISVDRGEPDWVGEQRLLALERLEVAGDSDDADRSAEVDFPALARRLQGSDDRAGRWPELPEEVVRSCRRQSVVFCSLDQALQDHPELVRPHFGQVVAAERSPAAALNAALWSGGAFVHVPAGVEVALPLQSYSRIDGGSIGQFQRTLIVAEQGSKLHYIDGCAAPIYTTDALRSSVVEVVVGPEAEVSCSNIQNWSGNVFNSVAKGATVAADGRMQWVDGNIGGRNTVHNTMTVLAGARARGEVLSVCYAGSGQLQQTEARFVHRAEATRSRLLAKSVANGGGRCRQSASVGEDLSFGGDRSPGAAPGHGGARGHGADPGHGGAPGHGTALHAGGHSMLRHDGLVLDQRSTAGGHLPAAAHSPALAVTSGEDCVGISSQQLFYLMSRGLSREQAVGTVVNGFIDPVTRVLPMEYAIEWSRLVELQMEGSVG